MGRVRKSGFFRAERDEIPFGVVNRFTAGARWKGASPGGLLILLFWRQ
jgi:hypothetical protein